jgi:hydrogenase expression/formation protein HypC
MCQSLPAQVVRIEGDQAWVQGSQASVSLLAIDDVNVGDYIIYHAGLALARVDPAEAAAIAEAFRELEGLYATE